MKPTKHLVSVLMATALALGAAVLIWVFATPAVVTVRVPELSAAAESGKRAFDADCAQCHGANASGTDKGPPLVHDIYNPGHHNDTAFFGAARQGVRQHHWQFGDMPPQSHVTETQLAAIIRYVRELQEANRITYKPHSM